jgi:hypothetical protein
MAAAARDASDILRGIFWIFSFYVQHCFICRPTDSIVSEDAEIEPGTVATMTLAKACNAPGAVYTRGLCCIRMCLQYTTEACVAHSVDVSTLQRPVLHLDVPTPQRPELHLDLSTLQRPSCVSPGGAYTTEALAASADLTTLQKPLLQMDVPTPQGAAAAPMDLSTLQRAVQLLEVSTLQLLVLVLDSIREIGSSISRCIYIL